MLLLSSNIQTLAMIYEDMNLHTKSLNFRLMAAFNSHDTEKWLELAQHYEENVSSYQCLDKCIVKWIKDHHIDISDPFHNFKIAYHIHWTALSLSLCTGHSYSQKIFNIFFLIYAFYKYNQDHVFRCFYRLIEGKYQFNQSSQ